VSGGSGTTLSELRLRVEDSLIPYEGGLVLRVKVDKGEQGQEVSEGELKELADMLIKGQVARPRHTHTHQPHTISELIGVLLGWASGRSGRQAQARSQGSSHGHAFAPRLSARSPGHLHRASRYSSCIHHTSLHPRAHPHCARAQGRWWMPTGFGSILPTTLR
jgi:hypothetical protein